MEISHWVAARHGLAHTSQLYSAGFSKYEARKAVDAGLLRRVRRSWLLSRDCDPVRETAVRAGGGVTCLSAARLYGLWTPPHDAVHVAVASNAAPAMAESVRVHWGSGPVPVAAHASEEPVINVLYHVARCRPETEALAVWDSAVRTRTVDLEVLARVQWRSTRAARVLALADAASDSGMETHFVGLMRGIGVVVRQQVWIDGRPVDGLIGTRLIVQLDGFAHHSSAAGRRRDLEADARLRLRGYTVLRFDYQQVFFRPEYVCETVQTAIAQRLHR